MHSAGTSVRVSRLGPLEVKALLAHTPTSCGKGLRQDPRISQTALHRVRKRKGEEFDPGTCLILGSALKLLMAPFPQDLVLPFPLFPSGFSNVALVWPPES